MAAGLTVRPDRVHAFGQAFESHAQEVLTPDLLEPVERVDAIVSGSELGLPLAEELELLEPCGTGNPRGRLYVPGARFGDIATMGEGRHARFSVTSGGTRARAVAFGCEGRLPARAGEPVDATFRLERNVWKGAVEPRLVLRCARRCVPGKIEVLGEPEDYVSAVLGELDGPLSPPGRVGSEDGPASSGRNVLDRRGESPLAVLEDALADGAVLAVCADVPRRAQRLRERIGGFSLISYPALLRSPELTGRFAHLVAFDPPSDPVFETLLHAGAGFAHLAWGEAELRFAQQIHELEYGLRASLTVLYRALKLQGRAAGEELERLLRGDGSPGHSPTLAARLIKVLTELELVSLDRDLPALTLAGTAPTTLERSPAYRVYAQQHEEGRLYLSSVNPRRGA